jgi:hypothetical protein
MEKHLGREMPLLWRVEWVPRKSGTYLHHWIPHIHLLTFVRKFIPHQLVKRWWGQAITWDGYLRTECKRVQSESLAGYYVAKYTAKMADDPSLVNHLKGNIRGRHYGYKRLSLIPRHARVAVLGNTPRFRTALGEIGMAELPDHRPDEEVSFTLLGEKAERWKEIIMQIAVDEGLTRE